MSISFIIINTFPVLAQVNEYDISSKQSHVSEDGLAVENETIINARIVTDGSSKRVINFRNVIWRGLSDIKYELFGLRPETLLIDKSTGDRIRVRNPGGAIWISNTTLSSLAFECPTWHYEPTHFQFYNSNIKSLSFDTTRILRLGLHKTHVENVRLNNVTIDSGAHLNLSNLPRSIALNNITFRHNSKLYIRIDDSSDDGLCELDLRKVDVAHINFSYSRMRLVFPSAKADYKIRFYKRLLKKFEDERDFASYENLDIEYRAFIYHQRFGVTFGTIVDSLDKWWWEYGYNRQKVIRGSMVLYLFFILINLFFYESLVTRGYPITKFADIDAEQKKSYANRPILLVFKRLPFVILYTGYIFWGLKLEKENISIHNLGAFVYVLIQYVVGVFCLAYIANLIITR